MAEETTHAALDAQAQRIADLLDDLPWCECTGFLVVEEEDETPDPELNRYLQAFDVLVFDGYVADFMRMTRASQVALAPHFPGDLLMAQVTVPLDEGEDPNQVPLSLMVHYNPPHDEAVSDAEYLQARARLLEVVERVVSDAVEEWTQEEEDESPVETLV